MKSKISWNRQNVTRDINNLSTDRGKGRKGRKGEGEKGRKGEGEG
jgi:hypothetical protein